MAARNSGRKDGRGGRLYGDYLDVGVLALEILAYASDCSARADAGYEDIDLTVGILVYFRTRGLKMRLGVCGIDELSGDKAVLDLLSKLVSLCDCSLHTLCALGENKLSAVGLYELAALNAHGFGHYDDYFISPCCGDGRKADARIARCGFNDGSAGLQFALGFSVIKNCLGYAVLYRTGGVEILELCQNGSLQALFLFDVGQLQQRSLSDKLIGGFINLRHDY